MAAVHWRRLGMARQRQTPVPSMPLPPPVSRSPDGEEGYADSQRRLERFSRSTEAREAVRGYIVPPPNRTVGHVVATSTRL